MNLIYVYSTKYELLTQFHAANGWGIETICGVLIRKPTDLPPETRTALVLRQKKVIVKRMN